MGEHLRNAGRVGLASLLTIRDLVSDPLAFLFFAAWLTWYLS